MKIILSGLCGHMGREVAALAEANYRGAELIAGVDAFAGDNTSVPCAKSFAEGNLPDCDCIVDFSHHTCTHDILAYAVEKNIPVVLCTTGQTEEELAEIEAASKKIPLFFSANMSLGVALLVELAKKTAAAMPDAEIEIIEKHHDRKLDAPSGTALMIANAIREVRKNAFNVLGRSGHGKRTKEEIGIHAIRMGNIVGEHEVIVGTPNQTITLKHEAHNRALFAEGALAAAQWLVGKGAGRYEMKDMVTE